MNNALSPTLPAAFSVEQYMEQGFTGPIPIMSAASAAACRHEFYQVIGQDEASPSATSANLSAFHHRHRWAYDICTLPSIVDPISQLLGSADVVLWAMHFWYKEPHNDTFIPWHQDAHYWPMDPAINATAWLALGPTFEDNGCLRLIPGSHSKVFEHTPQEAGSAFAQGISDVDEQHALSVEMSPGQAVFFNERMMHGSKPNISSTARVACSIRYTTPAVTFAMDDWGGDKDRIKTFLVKGQDRFHNNDAITGQIPL